MYENLYICIRNTYHIQFPPPMTYHGWLVDIPACVPVVGFSWKLGFILSSSAHIPLWILMASIQWLELCSNQRWQQKIIENLPLVVCFFPNDQPPIAMGMSILAMGMTTPETDGNPASHPFRRYFEVPFQRFPSVSWPSWCRSISADTQMGVS